ncbi:DUF4422 domain-containing protein [Jannaschia pohangensis]|uniref:Lipopolysaccharide biosynthesis protein, LPS:glycosyltransferase n=1 Tax=Jannaschia pohangensis TaxID=390807 RepID=A0A1I3THQ0_9RHOB|nr:DUF4422 domain-containing protein [Jannaschia pohangensis]SFJ70754.1 Lipopolysaccharide biosynthesis protein, LPS:glycosyltransferase [Jannaschia pohangensis]
MISIYVNYFAPAKIIETDVLRPIQVGAANSDLKLDMIGDDTGDNISARNPAYCEMTGIYWAWKNDRKSDVFGFMHYRRFFDFRSEPSRQIDQHGLMYHPQLDESLIKKYGLTRDVIEKVMDGCDMLVPAPFDVRGAGPANLRVHYETAPHHHIEDLDLAGRILGELSPEYVPYFDKAMSGRLLYPNNMFLFTREVFEEYCSWIFPILERLDAEIDVSEYSWQEARAVGYIAERLLTVFILRQKATKPRLVIKELERVFVRDTTADPEEPPLPETDKSIITVVASCDAAYIPHLGALVESIFSTTSSDYFLDFIVLDGGLGEGGRRLIRKIGQARADSSISFVDMTQKYLGLSVHSGFSRATFFRLSLPDILTKRDRILFLDTDMVVVDDIAVLYNMDLDGALIAAAPDLVIRAFAKMGVPSLHETGSLKTADYIADHLNMSLNGKPAIESYHQAGTLVMDLKGLRASGILRDAITDLAENTYWFLDQDILNKHLFGKIKSISSRWNVLWMDHDHSSLLSDGDRKMYEQSFENPAIVHYAGIGKPWRNSLNPLSHYYWEALRGTPWYETILFEFLDRRYLPHDPNAARMALQDPSLVKDRGVLRRATTATWRALPHRIKVKIWPLANRVKRAIDKDQ